MMMKKAGTGISESRSAPLSTDAGVGTGWCAHRWHNSIRRASIEEVRELDEVQEVEGLCGGLEIEEVPDRRERTGMRHLLPDHG